MSVSNQTALPKATPREQYDLYSNVINVEQVHWERMSKLLDTPIWLQCVALSTAMLAILIGWLLAEKAFHRMCEA